MSFLSTTALLDRIKTELEAIKLPAAFASAAAFEAVKLFDLADPLKAFEELLVFKNRAAFVVLENSDHENQVQGASMATARTLQVTLLLSDRAWKNRQIALTGDTTTPGALLLADLTVAALTGTLSDKATVGIPGLGQLFSLENKKREELPARICWSQAFTFHGGSNLVALPRGFAA